MGRCACGGGAAGGGNCHGAYSKAASLCGRGESVCGALQRGVFANKLAKRLPRSAPHHATPAFAALPVHLAPRSPIARPAMPSPLSLVCVVWIALLHAQRLKERCARMPRGLGCVGSSTATFADRSTDIFIDLPDRRGPRAHGEGAAPTRARIALTRCSPQPAPPTAAPPCARASLPAPRPFWRPCSSAPSVARVLVSSTGHVTPRPPATTLSHGPRPRHRPPFRRVHHGAPRLAPLAQHPPRSARRELGAGQGQRAARHSLRGLGQDRGQGTCGRDDMGN